MSDNSKPPTITLTELTAEELARAKIIGETSKMQWQELLRFFASGHALFVSPELNLVDVAFAMSEDNAAAVKQWMLQSQLGQVTDEQAKQWLDDDILVWSVVVKPWVMVQPVLEV